MNHAITIADLLHVALAVWILLCLRQAVSNALIRHYERKLAASHAIIDKYRPKAPRWPQ